MFDFDTPIATVAEASEIAGLKPGTGRSWIQKGWLGLVDGDRRATAPGATTFVSGRSVLTLAIAADLVSLGAHPEIACQSARAFCEISDPLDAPGHDRDPAGLFPGAFTSLVAYPDGRSAVLRTDGLTLLRQVHFPISPSAGARQEKGWIILVDPTAKRVELALEEIRAAKRGRRVSEEAAT